MLTINYLDRRTNKLVPVTGKPFKLPAPLDWVHAIYTADRGYHRITECRSGQRLADGKNRAETLKMLHEQIERYGTDRITAVIRSAECVNPEWEYRP